MEVLPQPVGPIISRFSPLFTTMFKSDERREGEGREAKMKQVKEATASKKQTVMFFLIMINNNKNNNNNKSRSNKHD